MSSFSFFLLGFQKFGSDMCGSGILRIYFIFLLSFLLCRFTSFSKFAKISVIISSGFFQLHTFSSPLWFQWDKCSIFCCWLLASLKLCSFPSVCLLSVQIGWFLLIYLCVHWYSLLCLLCSALGPIFWVCIKSFVYYIFPLHSSLCLLFLCWNFYFYVCSRSECSSLLGHFSESCF